MSAALPAHGEQVWRRSDGYGPYTVIALPGSRFAGSDWVVAADPHGIGRVGAPMAFWTTTRPEVPK